jgi:hypothetical protein
VLTPRLTRAPEDSVEAFAEVYRLIQQTTRELKPYSVTQICPCGSPPTFSLLPYYDQAVTADPGNSAQVLQRIKFYKALLGPRAAVSLPITSSSPTRARIVPLRSEPAGFPAPVHLA